MYTKSMYKDKVMLCRLYDVCLPYTRITPRVGAELRLGLVLMESSSPTHEGKKPKWNMLYTIYVILY